jgi:hypothetical protein
VTSEVSRRLVRPRTSLINEVVTLDPVTPHHTVAFVARLRDLHTELTDVVWHASIAPEFDVTSVVHLPPPQPDGGRSGALAHWRETHRPAMFHYRTGPGFIVVRDTRPAVSAARFILDDPVLLDTFTLCLQPHLLTDLSSDARKAAALLLDERMLLRLDDWIVTLPNRMRRWPIPSQIV